MRREAAGYFGGDKKRDTLAVGWECPRCHRVWAPHVVECVYCQPQTEELKKSANGEGGGGDD